ncbi:MAG: sigma-70 family RNA polymerase sigma factor [Oscillospiraceae bacterium]|nr:sigma-70 family RNA polymerase sigma factor [Oscillospiraceae bacterium]
MAMTVEQINLVIAARNGDQRSFEALYGEFYEKVYALSRMILRNERDAEDVLQETFITAWQKLHTLNNPETFSVWVQVIARNLCNMQLRRKNVAILLDAETDIQMFDSLESDDLLPAVYAERDDLRQRFSDIIDSLSEVQRQTITLYYFNELSIEEISMVMECSPGTVKSRLFLARNAIKAEVEASEHKHNERFYGIAGIPMLPLARLIQSHIKAISINSGSAAASFRAVSDSLVSQNQHIQTVKEAGNMKNKMSLGTKILIAALSVVGIAALVVLTVLLVNMFNKKEPDDVVDSPPVLLEVLDNENIFPINDPEIPSLDDIDWSLLEGYWKADHMMFVGFFSDGDDIRFEYGLLQSGFGVRSTIIDTELEPDGSYTVTIFVAAIEPNEVDDGRPEHTEVFSINLDTLSTDEVIELRIDNSDGENWHSYTRMGDTLDNVGYTSPEFFELLQGYWYTVDDEQNPFVGFFGDESTGFIVSYGVFQSWFGFEFQLIHFIPISPEQSELTVFFQAVPASGDNMALPERIETLRVDTSRLNEHGEILISIDQETEESFVTYYFGGYTADEAYANWPLSE